MNETDTGLNRYLREIGRFSLLTPQQEIELALAAVCQSGEESRRKIVRLRTVGIRPASLDAGEGRGEDAQTPFELLRDEAGGEVDGLIAVLEDRKRKKIRTD